MRGSMQGDVEDLAANANERPFISSFWWETSPQNMGTNSPLPCTETAWVADSARGVGG